MQERPPRDQNLFKLCWLETATPLASTDTYVEEPEGSHVLCDL